jgi:hypothetical protein
MKILVCVKVAEAGEPEPLCATAVATDEREACAKLLELADRTGWSGQRDPWGLALALTNPGEAYYVEQHELP